MRLLPILPQARPSPRPFPLAEQRLSVHHRVSDLAARPPCSLALPALCPDVAVLVRMCGLQLRGGAAQRAGARGLWAARQCGHLQGPGRHGADAGVPCGHRWEAKGGAKGGGGRCACACARARTHTHTHPWMDAESVPVMYAIAPKRAEQGVRMRSKMQHALEAEGTSRYRLDALWDST